MSRAAGRVVTGAYFIVMVSCSGSNSPDMDRELPALSVRIGDITARRGEFISVPVGLTSIPGSPTYVDSLSSFNLLIEYRYDALRLLDVKPGDGDSLWEYFTYRSDGKSSQQFKRDAVRIIAHRDIHDGIPPSPSQTLPTGTIACLVFEVNVQPELNGISAVIGFQSLDCEDNTFTDGADPGLLHFMSEYRTTDTLGRANDTLDCPRRVRLVSDVRYESGIVRIGTDSTDLPPLPGDVDLNGVGPNISDAVLFTNELLTGSAFSEDSTIRARQLVASDVNRDGIPLQVADYEMLVRVIAGEVDMFQPHEPISHHALVNKSGWGVEISSAAELSLIYIEFDLGTDTTVTNVIVFPPSANIRVKQDGSRIGVFINNLYAPLVTTLAPLRIDLLPPPSSGFAIAEIQLSTPPGLSVPVSIRGFP